jgi:hypothetical protein
VHRRTQNKIAGHLGKASARPVRQGIEGEKPELIMPKKSSLEAGNKRHKHAMSGSYKSVKTLAASALTQRPVSKRGSITVQQANTAVREYLSKRK